MCLQMMTHSDVIKHIVSEQTAEGRIEKVREHAIVPGILFIKLDKLFFFLVTLLLKPSHSNLQKSGSWPSSPRTPCPSGSGAEGPTTSSNSNISKCSDAEACSNSGTLSARGLAS